jgi:hypothetical protein
MELYGLKENALSRVRLSNRAGRYKGAELYLQALPSRALYAAQVLADG